MIPDVSIELPDYIDPYIVTLLEHVNRAVDMVYVVDKKTEKYKEEVPFDIPEDVFEAVKHFTLLVHGGERMTTYKDFVWLTDWATKAELFSKTFEFFLPEELKTTAKSHDELKKAVVALFPVGFMFQKAIDEKEK